MIPRKEEKVMGEIGVNAICFMGSILIKNMEMFNDIKENKSPTELLSNITFPLL
jgi:ATP adenylyltransferase/5',5'''-P-1,P-4-tetraphosphate phosphorylase II